MPLSASDYPNGAPVYTYVCDDGTNIHIDATKLRAWCIAMKPPIYAVPVDHAEGQRYLRDNICSFDRCMELALSPRHARLDPIIFGHRGTSNPENGSPNVMLIDGHHRYALASILRLPIISAHLIMPEIWQTFQVIGLPDLTQDQLRNIPLTQRSY
jgi:hypothetical protein